jgi:hypothetical protein
LVAALEAAFIVVAVFLVDMKFSGHVVFTDAKVAALQKADAIVVPGGEHDGREDYRLSLAREGWGSHVDPRKCRPRKRSRRGA